MFRAVPGQGAGQGVGQSKWYTDVWGGVPKTEGVVYHHPTAYTAVFVLAFGAKPDSPRRASGEGLDGSDPPFLTAGAVSRVGGCTTRCTTWCTTTPPS